MPNQDYFHIFSAFNELLNSALMPIILPHLILFYSETFTGPSLLGFLKSCFPHSSKTLSSRVKLSSSVVKKRLKAKVWEAEQVIISSEDNTWKYISTARIWMQENSLKYISSEGKNIYGMPWDCKTGHNSAGVNKDLPICIRRTAGSGYFLCIPL